MHLTDRLRFTPLQVDMAPYKHIAAYVERLQARPAWQAQAKRLKELEEKLA